MQITIPQKHRKYLEGKVKKGHFRTARDVVDAALSRMQEHDNALADLMTSLDNAARDIDDDKGIPWNLGKAQARLLGRVASREKRRRAS